MPKKDIRNLIFEGGGIKGLAYLGVIEVLEYNGILKNVKRVAGSSVGAIIAGLIAVGYKSKELKELMDLNFEDFKDESSFFASNIKRLLKNFGWYKGDKFQEWFEKLISDKSWKKEMTFRDLHDRKDKGAKELYVIGSDIGRKGAVIFSYENTPDLKISDAIRISIGIPILYESVKYKDSLFVDGGIYYNYPIDIFDNLDYVENKKNFSEKDNSNKETLGFRVESPSEKKIINFDEGAIVEKINSLKDYISILVGNLMDMENRTHLHEKDEKRTIFIDSKGISASDFELSEKRKNDLIEAGIEATEKWIRKN